MKIVSHYLNSILGHWFPQRSIYMRSENSTRYICLSPVAQVLMGIGAVAVIGWSIIALSAVLVGKLYVEQNHHHSQIIRTSYQNRFKQISQERDQQADKARIALDRFYIALEQISTQQSELLKAEEEKHELALGLKNMQRKLQHVIRQRDSAQVRSDSLLAELDSLSGNLTTRLNDFTDTKATLTFLTNALRVVSIQREQAVNENKKYRVALADLKFDSQLLKQRNNHVFTQLGNALDASILVLERTLDRKGIDIENLVNEIRSSYSGVGGPLLPFSASVANSLTDPLVNRVSMLLNDLDRINILNIAMKNIPLGHPVRGRYRYTSGFGKRIDPISGRWSQHNGIDMAAPKGTDIIATADGVVTFAGYQKGYGKLIKIRHRHGFESLYGHLHHIRVKAGKKIQYNQHIADMGNTGRSTGNHLHYEIHKNGKSVNPTQYLKVIN